MGTEYYSHIQTRNLANAIREVRGFKELIELNATITGKNRAMTVYFEVYWRAG